jgi:hypothetical protein
MHYVICRCRSSHVECQWIQVSVIQNHVTECVCVRVLEWMCQLAVPTPVLEAGQLDRHREVQDWNPGRARPRSGDVYEPSIFKGVNTTAVQSRAAYLLSLRGTETWIIKDGVIWITWLGADMWASRSTLLINFEPINGFSLNFAQTSTKQSRNYSMLVITMHVILNLKVPIHTSGIYHTVVSFPH